MSNLRKLKRNLHKQCPKCGKYGHYKENIVGDGTVTKIKHCDDCGYHEEKILIMS